MIRGLQCAFAFLSTALWSGPAWSHKTDGGKIMKYGCRFTYWRRSNIKELKWELHVKTVSVLRPQRTTCNIKRICLLYCLSADFVSLLSRVVDFFFLWIIPTFKKKKKMTLLYKIRQGKRLFSKLVLVVIWLWRQFKSLKLVWGLIACVGSNKPRVCYLADRAQSCLSQKFVTCGILQEGWWWHCPPLSLSIIHIHVTGWQKHLTSCPAGFKPLTYKRRRWGQLHFTISQSRVDFSLHYRVRCTKWKFFLKGSSLREHQG